MSLTTECKKWRRRETFGGFLWPVTVEEKELKKQTPIREDEKLTEILWLLDAGESAHYVAQVFGATLTALERFSYRNGRPDLGRQFSEAQKI
jgi:hypothetical protein